MCECKCSSSDDVWSLLTLSIVVAVTLQLLWFGFTIDGVHYSIDSSLGDGFVITSEESK